MSSREVGAGDEKLLDGLFGLFREHIVDVEPEGETNQREEPAAEPAPAPASPRDLVTTKRRHGRGEDVKLSYNSLCGSDPALFELLEKSGFVLTNFHISELHDRYEEFEDFNCSSFEAMNAHGEWKGIHGYWNLGGTFEGAEVVMHGGLRSGLEVRHASKDAKLVAPLITAIDDAFAPNRIEVEDGVLTRCVGSCKSVNVNADSIASQAFRNNKGLRVVVVKDGATEIGDQAFAGCSNLEQLSIPKSVKKIGVNAFFGCFKLRSAGPVNSRPKHDLGFGHTDELPAQLCFNLQNLERVEIPRGIATIGKECFGNCKKLRSVTLPETVTRIESRAFADCESLSQITLPATSGALSIADDAFKGCTALADKDGFVVIDGVLCDYLGNAVSLAIPEGVRRIAANALRRTRVDALGISRRPIERVTIPEGVERIGAFAFANSKKLTEVILPSTLVAIEDGAFRGCTALGKLDIPGSVAFIGEDALPPELPPKIERDPVPIDRLAMMVTNTGTDDQLAIKVRSFSARHAGDSPSTPAGRLGLYARGFTYTSAQDRQGWPSERGSFDPWVEACSLLGDVLEISADGKTYRFQLSGSDLDEAAFYLELLRQLRERTAPYSDPIATACAKDSWPGIAHPFFKANATEATDVEALFGFLTQDKRLRSFAFNALPWFTTSTTINQSEHSLIVTSGNSAEKYGYRETEHEVRLSYYTHTVGFFDDSEDEDEAEASLSRIDNPSEDVVRAAVDVSGLGTTTSNGPVYLKDPFGMSGIFRLTR